MVMGLFAKLAERRSQMRHVTPPMRLRIDGRSYPVVDWSLGGLRIEGYRGELRRLERVSGTLTISGGPKGPFLAEVMWQREQTVGLRFLEIAPKVFFELTTHNNAGA